MALVFKLQSYGQMRSTRRHGSSHLELLRQSPLHEQDAVFLTTGTLRQGERELLMAPTVTQHDAAHRFAEIGFQIQQPEVFLLQFKGQVRGVQDLPQTHRGAHNHDHCKKKHRCDQR